MMMMKCTHGPNAVLIMLPRPHCGQSLKYLTAFSNGEFTYETQI